MSTTITQAVNATAGVPSSIIPPSFADVGNSVIAVEVYNNTSSVLIVTASSGSRFLQPLTADLFPMGSIASAPTILPVSTAATNTVVGTVTSTLYYEGDALPSVPTFSLPPFPGGSSLLYVNPNPNNTNTSQLAQGAIVQPPEGATGLVILVNPGADRVAITGEQTGTAYVIQDVAAPGTPYNFSLIGLVDTSFQIQGDQHFPPSPKGIAQVNATVQAVPTIATSSSGEISLPAGNHEVLPAPSVGANYLFFADFYAEGTAGSEQGVRLVGHDSGITWAIWIGQVLVAPGVSDTLPFGPLRITEQLDASVSQSGTISTSGVQIRYTPGP